MKGGGGISTSIIIFCMILIIITTGTAISKFFNISFAAYAPYLVWFLALTLFYYVLPEQVSDIFKDV